MYTYAKQELWESPEFIETNRYYNSLFQSEKTFVNYAQIPTRLPLTL